MKLTKISYKSAVFFGVLSLVMYLPFGLVMWNSRDALLTQGVSITAVQTFLSAPIQSGILGYLMTMVMILVYNFVAVRYPISWEIKK
ncbi:MAG: hypothetical protein U9Q73_00300 [Nanoarchaeota archaeon]|nr:hypothetical protein [Nanoarchaeota archaeon]